MRSLKINETFTHSDTDDSVLSLHDCIAEKVEIKNNILTFVFENGIWIFPSHPANKSDTTVRSDIAQVDFHLDDEITINVLRKNIFKNTLCEDWDINELIDFINSKSAGLEFVYQYKSHGEQLLKCELKFNKRPFRYKCELIIPASKIIYSWNNLCYDKTW